MGRRIFSTVIRIILILVVVGFFVSMVLVAFDFAEPYIYPFNFVRGKAHLVEDRVIIGPYPHQKELQRLKGRFKVVEVISLMNRESPIERRLIDRERRLTKKIGLKFRLRPMSFTNLGSKENSKKAEELAEYVKEKYLSGTSKDSKVYIHCYLGKHRVGIFLKALRRLKGNS